MPNAIVCVPEPANVVLKFVQPVCVALPSVPGCVAAPMSAAIV